MIPLVVELRWPWCTSARERDGSMWPWTLWALKAGNFLEVGKLENWFIGIWRVTQYIQICKYVYIYRYDILNFMFQLCYFLDELVTRFEFFRYKKSKKSISDYLYTAFSWICLHDIFRCHNSAPPISEFRMEILHRAHTTKTKRYMVCYTVSQYF